VSAALPAELLELVYLRVSQINTAPSASTCTRATC
jgi:alkylhydroperoxidase family enzyme